MCPQSEDLCVPSSSPTATNKPCYLHVTTDQWLCVPSLNVCVSTVCKFVCPQSFMCPQSEDLCVPSSCATATNKPCYSPVTTDQWLCVPSLNVCVHGLQICVSTVVYVSPVWRSVFPQFFSHCYQQAMLLACDHWPVIVCPLSNVCVSPVQIHAWRPVTDMWWSSLMSTILTHKVIICNNGQCYTFGHPFSLVLHWGCLLLFFYRYQVETEDHPKSFLCTACWTEQEYWEQEPSPLRSEVARAIRQTASRKATGPDDDQAELFKAGGDAVLDRMHRICVVIWEMVSGQRNGRSPHWSHFARKVILNSVQNTEQLLWFPMQAKSFFGSYWKGSESTPTQKLQTNRWDSDKEEGQENKPRISEYWCTRHVSIRNHSICALWTSGRHSTLFQW